MHESTTQGGGHALLCLGCLGCGSNSCAVLEEGVWEVEVHSVVSVGGLGVALPAIVCGDDGRGSCVPPVTLSSESTPSVHQSTQRKPLASVITPHTSSCKLPRRQ